MNGNRWAFPNDRYAIARSLFLRGLGAIYLIAILSWWVQVDVLAGSGGLTPMGEFLENAGEALRSRGLSRWWNVPTLFWLNHGDLAIHVVCAAGVLLAALLIAGILPGPCLVGLWAVYLSLLSTGGIFMSFQWDILLVEAGFLAVWLAPWRGWRMPFKNPPPLGPGETCALWLAWFLIAKLMFQSGWVKLAWATEQQPEWWPAHTAMIYHYMTQPIPNPPAWWMYQLPAWFHKAAIWPMYFVELILPLFVFLGARLRLAAAIGFAGLMFLILTTGNYAYFNWLAIVLCLPLVADRFWRWRPWKKPGPDPVDPDSTGLSRGPDPVESGEKPAVIGFAVRAAPLAVIAFLNLTVCLSDWHLAGRQVRNPVLPATHLPWDLTPRFADDFRMWLQPFYLVSGYGLFRTMTIDRPEIILEGSADAAEWREYHLRWKPGKLDEPPPVVAPHQPRVAWQFWFAALERRYHPRSRNAPWFSRLIVKLLENDPVTLTLFEENPFTGEPPKYLRARLYQYDFTSREERRETGNWWKRKEAGEYLPAVSRQTK